MLNQCAHNYVQASLVKTNILPTIKPNSDYILNQCSFRVEIKSPKNFFSGEHAYFRPTYRDLNANKVYSIFFPEEVRRKLIICFSLETPMSSYFYLGDDDMPTGKIMEEYKRDLHVIQFKTKIMNSNASMIADNVRVTRTGFVDHDDLHLALRSGITDDCKRFLVNISNQVEKELTNTESFFIVDLPLVLTLHENQKYGRLSNTVKHDFTISFVRACVYDLLSHVPFYSEKNEVIVGDVMLYFAKAVKALNHTEMTAEFFSEVMHLVLSEIAGIGRGKTPRIRYQRLFFMKIAQWYLSDKLSFMNAKLLCDAVKHFVYFNPDKFNMLFFDAPPDNILDQLTLKNKPYEYDYLPEMAPKCLDDTKISFSKFGAKFEVLIDDYFDNSVSISMYILKSNSSPEDLSRYVVDFANHRCLIEKLIIPTIEDSHLKQKEYFVQEIKRNGNEGQILIVTCP